MSDPRVTERCLACCDGPDADAAEHLWRVLVRTVPVPHRAEPAVLLAVTVYLRGDGTLAHLALDAADTAAPGHRMAGLLRRALQAGITPDQLRVLTIEALNGTSTSPQGGNTE